MSAFHERAFVGISEFLALALNRDIGYGEGVGILSALVFVYTFKDNPSRGCRKVKDNIAELEPPG